MPSWRAPGPPIPRVARQAEGICARRLGVQNGLTVDQLRSGQLRSLAGGQPEDIFGALDDLTPTTLPRPAGVPSIGHICTAWCRLRLPVQFVIEDDVATPEDPAYPGLGLALRR